MLEGVSSIFETIMQFNTNNNYIDVVVVLLVCLSDFFAKRYLVDINLKDSVKTLIVGTIFTIGYIVVLQLSGGLLKANFEKYFISYAVATSLNELLVRWLVTKISKFFKKEEENPVKDTENKP